MKIPTPASFQQPTTDAAAKSGHRQEQASSGDFGVHISDANGQKVSLYDDPAGTVFIDRDSHDGAWVKFLNDTNHGERNA